MKFYIEHQEQYSRGEALLRQLFGAIYIMIPHAFLLFFVGIASNIVTLIAFFAVLITGRYPEGMYRFQEKFMRWQLRVQARMLHLCDGYPAFGLGGEDDKVKFELNYPESISRGLTLLRQLFGFIYVVIPHAFVLIFRMIGVQFVTIIAFFAILFTGRYPQGMHEFVVGTLRWGARVNLYMLHMSDIYPPFSGKTDEELGLETGGSPSEGGSEGSSEAPSSDEAASRNE